MDGADSMRKKSYEVKLLSCRFVAGVVAAVKKAIPDGTWDRFVRDAVREKCQRENIAIPEYEE